MFFKKCSTQQVTDILCRLKIQQKKSPLRREGKNTKLKKIALSYAH